MPKFTIVNKEHVNPLLQILFFDATMIFVTYGFENTRLQSTWGMFYPYTPLACAFVTPYQDLVNYITLWFDNTLNMSNLDVFDPVLFGLFDYGL